MPPVQSWSQNEISEVYKKAIFFINLHKKDYFYNECMITNYWSVSKTGRPIPKTKTKTTSANIKTKTKTTKFWSRDQDHSLEEHWECSPCTRLLWSSAAERCYVVGLTNPHGKPRLWYQHRADGEPLCHTPPCHSNIHLFSCSTLTGCALCFCSLHLAGLQNHTIGQVSQVEFNVPFQH